LLPAAVAVAPLPFKCLSRKSRIAVSANLVRLLRETVAFVVEDNIFDDAVLLFDGVDNLIGLRFNDARVVRALQNNERLRDLVRMVPGENGARGSGAA
jgi:hypothetical protein